MTIDRKERATLNGLISAWTMEARRRESVANNHQSIYGNANDVVIANQSKADILRSCVRELEHAFDTMGCSLIEHTPQP